MRALHDQCELLMVYEALYGNQYTQLPSNRYDLVNPARPQLIYRK